MEHSSGSYPYDNHVMVIINPISGSFSKQRLEPLLVRHLDALGYEVKVFWTSSRGDATRFTSNAVKENMRAVIVVGGDGTINECASQLCNTPVAMGIIPTGSGNGLARHLNIPTNIQHAIRVIEQGHVTYCDYGSINGTPFFCTSGLGFDAAVSAEFDRSKKRGIMNYLRSAVKEYRKYRPKEYVLSIGDQILTERALIVAICNASQYGNNAYIAPKADITDGLLDITVVHQGNLITNAIAGMDLMTGYIYRNMLVDTFRTAQASIIMPEDAIVHMDGEPMMCSKEIAVRCHHHGLKIYTPVSTARFVPVITPTREFFKATTEFLFPRTRWRK